MIPSLNLQYIFVRMIEILLSVPVDFSGLPGRLQFLVESVATTGMVLAVVFLVLTVYVRIQLIQAEHHGFLEIEERERLARIPAQTSATNPQWEVVQSLANSPNESDWRRAILEADIMLANVLTERGYIGDTVGEQLKGANPLQFTTLNLAWEAHRTRNAIAHLGEGFPLSERDMRATIDQYRRVFEEFQYI